METQIKILYHVHIMWYEYKIINELLDSLQHAISLIDNNTIVDIKLCLNAQTYIEVPQTNDVIQLFDEFKSHPVLTNSNIVYKTMHDEFYNIGDWRRENYGEDYDFYVWGESDSLVPEDYFFNLSSLYRTNIPFPYIVTYSQRKMWDDTWNLVEHNLLKYIPYENFDKITPEPLMAGHYMNMEQLNSFNRLFDSIVIKLDSVKVDGNMTAFSRGIPQPLLPDNLHFAREDYAVQIWCQHHNIPQYHFPLKLKAHNFKHPNKRKQTKSTRGEELYIFYEKQSYDAINNLIQNINS
jgi:hypothetical protein